MKRIQEIKFELKNAKIFIIGAKCTGKTTIAKLLVDLFEFNFISIDEYRIKFSDGTIAGENLAYQRFISDANNYANEKPCIIECTGLSYHFEELETKSCFVIYLECSAISAKFREIERSETYQAIPFPYNFNQLSNSLNFLDKFQISFDTFTHFNTDETSEIEIVLFIAKILRKKNTKDFPKSTKKQWQFIERKDYYYL